MPSLANERQEGGDHYKQPPGVPEHWDLAITYQWDPFQYQITKYVMRWKDKHDTPEKKLEDLMKGLHFYQKYIENWKAFLNQDARPPPTFDYQMFAEQVQVEGYVGGSLTDYRCKKCRLESRQSSARDYITFHNQNATDCVIEEQP